MGDIAGDAANAAAGVDGSVGDAAVGGDNSGADNGGGESLNPAWSPMLEKLPSSLHPLVTPHLREWDSNFQRKVQEVQSGFEPYKQVIGDTDTETLQQAINFYRMAETDPKRIWETMAQYYGFGNDTPDQGQQAQQGTENFDIDGATQDDLLNHPKVQELLQNQQALASVVMNQVTQQQQAQAEAALDAEISALKESHGYESEDDLIMVLNIANARNVSLKEAGDILKGYTESQVNAAATRRVAAPSVMSAGGTVPADNTVNPKNLDNKGTRSLVEDILRANANQ